nr:MAG TPA: hypothetical protein [Caudoviricetes sp.]
MGYRYWHQPQDNLWTVAIEVPLFPYTHFQVTRVGTSKAPAHFVFLALPQRVRRKGQENEIKGSL